MSSDGGNGSGRGPSVTRRRALLGTAGVVATAGCIGLGGGGSNDAPREVTGRIRTPDGSGLADATVGAVPPVGENQGWFATLTGSDGSFTLGLPEKRFLLCVYQFTDDDTSTSRFDVAPNGLQLPRDDVPDFYGFADVSATATDAGTTTLPEGYLVEAQVTDADGNPVAEALIDFEQVMSAGRIGLVGFRTNAQGRFAFSRDGTGVEARGSVRVAARPPKDSDRFPDQEQSTDLDVTGDRSVTLELGG